MKKFITKVDSEGNSYSVLNPKWAEYIQKEHYKYFLENSNIPKDYWDLEFDCFKWEKSLESVNKCIVYAKNILNEDFKNISLYLYGSNSTGKTTIACAIGKEAIRQGLNVQYILAGDLINSLMKNSGFSFNAESNEIINKLEQAQLIILDEAFDKKKSILWTKEDSKALIISAWDIFLRSALSNDKKFIIQSNIDLPQVGLDYGQSIYELIDRNFIVLPFYDQVKIVRKKKQEKIFDRYLS